MTVKVLHLLGPLQASGMERMLVSSLKEFQSVGVETFVAGQGRSHSYAGDMREAGLDVYEIEPVGRSFAAAREFRSLVRRLEIDVVHLHTEGRYLPTAIAVWWALGCRRRLVRTVHNIFDARGLGYWRRLIQAMLADRLVGEIVAPSSDVAAVERRFARRCTVIHNWVDDRMWDIRKRRLLDRTRRRSPVAVLVGNCSPIKQHERALRQLLQRDFLVMHLGSEQSASHEERDILDSLETQGKVLTRGVDAPDDALLSGDVFLMPSLREGMPVALAEAHAVGMHVLANDAPGLQWARGLPGVELLPDTDSAWAERLDSWNVARPGGPSDAAGEGIDLTSSRGASEYFGVYRRLADRSNR